MPLRTERTPFLSQQGTGTGKDTLFGQILKGLPRPLLRALRGADLGRFSHASQPPDIATGRGGESGCFGSEGLAWRVFRKWHSSSPKLVKTAEHRLSTGSSSKLGALWFGSPAPVVLEIDSSGNSFGVAGRDRCGVQLAIRDQLAVGGWPDRVSAGCWIDVESCKCGQRSIFSGYCQLESTAPFGPSDHSHTHTVISTTVAHFSSTSSRRTRCTQHNTT